MQDFPRAIDDAGWKTGQASDLDPEGSIRPPGDKLAHEHKEFLSLPESLFLLAGLGVVGDGGIDNDRIGTGLVC